MRKYSPVVWGPRFVGSQAVACLPGSCTGSLLISVQWSLTHGSTTSNMEQDLGNLSKIDWRFLIKYRSLVFGPTFNLIKKQRFEDLDAKYCFLCFHRKTFKLEEYIIDVVQWIIMKSTEQQNNCHNWLLMFKKFEHIWRILLYNYSIVHLSIIDLKQNLPHYNLQFLLSSSFYLNGCRK